MAVPLLSVLAPFPEEEFCRRFLDADKMQRIDLKHQPLPALKFRDSWLGPSYWWDPKASVGQPCAGNKRQETTAVMSCGVWAGHGLSVSLSFLPKLQENEESSRPIASLTWWLGASKGDDECETKTN